MLPACFYILWSHTSYFLPYTTTQGDFSSRFSSPYTARHILPGNEFFPKAALDPTLTGAPLSLLPFYFITLNSSVIPASGILHILHIKIKKIRQYSFSISQVCSLLHPSSQLKGKGTSHFAFSSIFPFLIQDAINSGEHCSSTCSD